MITPFNLKAKVDLDVVSVLVDFYLEAGVKGFFANCLSSEMYSISEDERLELTRHVVNSVAGRAPIVATGSFGLTIEDKADFAAGSMTPVSMRSSLLPVIMPTSRTAMISCSATSTRCSG